ncbi:hypothetical protein [Nocardia wallacei]|nr:hypothetical protein [Nocardia wallacei]
MVRADIADLKQRSQSHDARFDAQDAVLKSLSEMMKEILDRLPPKK